MSGYVASARIVHAAPRLAPSGASRDGLVEASRARVSEAQIVESEQSTAAASIGIADRVAAVRDRWSQLTFFLFDPNSWR